MKYILTEKLKAEIEKRQEVRQDIRDSASWENEYWPESDFCTRDDEDDAILSIIISLQQEQPEVDFEKELDRIWFDNKLGNYFDNDALDYAHIKTLCKHFYELGLNARKEE